MLESVIEAALKTGLEQYGFKCPKLVTPGYSGVPDRLILQPMWSPAPPAFVELKRPNARERKLQAAVRDEWRERGCDVRRMCDTIERVQRLCSELLVEAVWRWQRLNAAADSSGLPTHIRDGYLIASRYLQETTK